MDKQIEIIKLLKEQNKRLNALQIIEADNNNLLGAINIHGFNNSALDKWGKRFK